MASSMADGRGMFALPEAKRVRRADLNASDDSADSDGEDGGYDAELEAKLNAQIAKSLGIDTDYSRWSTENASPNAEGRKQAQNERGGKAAADDDDGDADAGDEEFAFRLFSNTKPSQTVVIEEDVAVQGDGGIVGPGRPLSYYMITNLTAEQKQEFSYAAMSGDEILARSKGRAWGLELPWKVTRIAVTRKVKPGEAGSKSEPNPEEATRGKRRAGKKQRISLRKRAKAREEKKAAEVQRVAEKEEHIKDKKKRMNRLKKLRKRAKNKEKKLETQGEGEGEEDKGSGDESSGSE